MKKNKFIIALKEVFVSSKFINTFVFLAVALILTLVLSCKYFLFQSIISPEGISKKDVVAKKTIEVVDVFKTEQQRKEVMQRISPILTPAEDAYVKSNLSVLEKSIWEIKDKISTSESKRVELSTLFDIEDSSRKQLIVNYFLTASRSDIELIFKKAFQTLDKILKEGVSEEDFDKNIYNIIFKHIRHDVSKNRISIITGLIEQVIIPNLVVDEKATMIARQNAANSIKPVIVRFEKNEKIVFAGEPVTRLKRDALNNADYNVLELNIKGFLAIFLLVSFGIMTLLFYLKNFEKKFMTKQYLLIIFSLSVIMAFLVIFIPDGGSEFIMPFPAYAMLIAIFINSRVSIVTSSILLAIIALTMQFPMVSVIVLLLTVILSAILISKIKYAKRVDLVKAGIKILAAMIVLIIISFLIQSCVYEIDLSKLKQDIIAGFINGILSGMIVSGVIPVLESIFQIITPYGLVEFGEHNPLLKRLQEAPGTFSHSVTVANLCEAAAEAIDANPVLAKVGALYHDVGKLKRPLFFVENQTFYGIENPHTKLNPRLSKMVITAHTRDGIDLAKEYGIPPIIQNFIIQHHGESLAGHFYNQAVQQEGQENVTEEQFRYTGPKPNMKETAILMIADAVESASRTLKDYSEESVENLINKIITDKLNDGQLSDSPLTLKDLKVIAQTLNKHIRAAHHQRIKYHEGLEDLENKVKKMNKVATPSKLTDTELEDKIEKKIEKRRQEIENEKKDKS